MLLYNKKGDFDVNAEPSIEIERKYIIKKPKSADMMGCEGYSSSEIVQIYLASQGGVTHRIRSRAYREVTRYFETTKIRIDKMSSHEYEREIDRGEFESLSLKIAEDSRPIVKTRYTFDFSGQTFEIDVYPEWEKTAIMETELPSRETAVTFPDFIRVIAEVTGDKRYSNAAMSREFPKETEMSE